MTQAQETRALTLDASTRTVEHADWAVLWTLCYVLFLGSYGIPAQRDETTEGIST